MREAGGESLPEAEPAAPPRNKCQMVVAEGIARKEGLGAAADVMAYGPV